MKYSVMVFDVDGTLIDTEEAILLSLQHMLLRVTGRLYPVEELYFALGITGAEALRRLQIADTDKAMAMWLAYMERYAYLQKPFEGIADVINWLKEMGVRLGIVTSRTREEFDKSVAKYSFVNSFETIICADDTKKHKPDAQPMLALIERMKVSPARTLYIGDSEYDMQCAKGAGVDSALALWGAHYPEQIPSVFKLRNINDIKALLN